MRSPLLVLGYVLLAATPSLAEWVDVVPGGDPLAVEVLVPQPGRTVVEYRVGGFERNEVLINGSAYDVIGLGSESKDLTRGHPELPNVCRALLLPETGAVEIRVLESSQRDVPGIRVATMGIPLAMASSAARGMPSLRDVSVAMSVCARISGTSSRYPRK